MFHYIKSKKLFFLMFFSITFLIAMDDPTNKSPREAAKASPGCIRQNSHELMKMLLTLAADQGNLGLLSELQIIEAQPYKEETKN